MSSSLRVGDTMPDFTLPAHDGSQVSLASLRAKGPVVLFFYPRNETPGCTAQACSFRDQFADFRAAGATVVGLSRGDVAAHAAFAAHRRLPYLLLCDEDDRVRRLLGVPRTLGIFPGRVTYVVAATGRVEMVYNSQFYVGQHATRALAALRALKPPLAA